MTSTGSSFAGVAISQWQGQFNELDGGNINFTVSSSVIGMNDFCQQTVDFGATDIAYSTQQSDCTTNQVPYPFQYMPTVAGGLAFEYNVTGQNGQQVTNLVLDASTLWASSQGPSPTGTTPPSPRSIRHPATQREITAYYRGDPSGENYLLGDYFFHTHPGPLTAFQQAAVPSPAGQPSATWGRSPTARHRTCGPGQRQRSRRRLAGAGAHPGGSPTSRRPTRRTSTCRWPPSSTRPEMPSSPAPTTWPWLSPAQSCIRTSPRTWLGSTPTPTRTPTRSPHTATSSPSVCRPRPRRRTSPATARAM